MVSFVATAVVVAGIGAAAQAAPTWESISQAVTQQKLSSVEELLGWFATNEPNQLDHFTLMRRSGSIQDASELFPRAIVFGEDARFIFTFNGHAEQRQNDAVEFLQFRERTPESDARWELREIRFQEGRPAEISGPNPTKCLQCHGLEPQPIWAEYDFWPGAYGEHDDAIVDFSEKYMRRGIDSDLRVAEGEYELAAYKEFLAGKDEHPRYAQLHFREGSPVTPFDWRRRTGYLFRPNLLLTGHLVRLQAQVVADRIFRQPGFSRLGPALTEAMMGCPTPEHAPSPLAKARAGFVANRSRFSFARWSPLGDGAQGTEMAKTMQLLGIDPTDFTMTPGTIFYSYFEGRGYLADAVAGDLYDRLRRPHDGVSFADVQQERDDAYYGKTPRQPDNDDEDAPPPPPSKFEEACQLLAKRRAEATTVPPVRPSTDFVPRIVATCLACHDGLQAPVWGMDRNLSPEQKATWVDEVRIRVLNRPAQGAMPPDRALKLGEVRELMAYLNVLRRSH